MINQCVHCGKNLVTYKACRINADGYIEMYVNQTPLRVEKHVKNIPREQWESKYEELKLEAERMTAAFVAEAEDLLKRSSR